MTGGSHIRAIGQENASDQTDATDFEAEIEAGTAGETDTDPYDFEWEEETVTPRRYGWVVPTLAVLTVLGWSGFFGWAHRGEILAGGTPQLWSGWITAWATPVLLVVALWLLAMRNSRVEAARFGETAHMISVESRELEDRLSTINRELSLAREFLGSQSRELDSLGRIATERLSEHADRLQSLIGSNGEQVDAIATVSTTALENMGKLRDDLPVIANSARDVSNQIGAAGHSAQAQVDLLVSGFERLNEFGDASGRKVGSLTEQVDAAIATFEAQVDSLQTVTESRFAELNERSEAFRADLDGREVEALAAIRRRAEALGEELAGSRQSLDDDEEGALKSLRARLMALRDEAGTVGNAVREKEVAAQSLWSGQVEAIQSRLVEAIEEIQRIDETALSSANRKLEALKREAEAVDANIADRDAKLLATIIKRQQQLSDSEKEALAALEGRLAILDSAIAERQSAQLEQGEALAERSEAITVRMQEVRDIIEEVVRQGAQAEDSLAYGLKAVRENLGGSRETIEGMDESVASLTEATVRLLELIQASSQHSGNELPEAIGIAEERLTTVEVRADALRLMLGEASESGAKISGYVVEASDTGRRAIEDVETLHARIAASHEETVGRIAELRETITGLSDESDALGEKASGELRAAIASLEEAARAAADTIGAPSAERIRALADKVGEETADAVDRSIRSRATESIAELELASAHATEASRDTLLQLRDQLAKVNELAGNLETRVAHARERAEEQVDNDFARRMALIGESLNSSSIDIAKALSSEVTDMQWASYLRGDRGIFTRRAVRLLDNTVARDIAELYDSDYAFQENVSRYIADFEGMLRTMLSTRDGNALGVTLLSSDMGKLYVALAQAIDRLRD